jgi:hypothetical protein
VDVTAEPLGVNLFLHVRKRASSQVSAEEPRGDEGVAE